MLSVTLLSILVCAVHSAKVDPPLPQEAFVVESKSLASGGYPDLDIILWMVRPKSYPDEASDEETYACPEETRGSYYRGATRLSLFDRRSSVIVNTIEIRDYHFPQLDVFELPYRIMSRYYYRVDPDSRRRPGGKPLILDLKDYNADGRPLEFVLFDKANCSQLMTALFGFSERQHKVIQYDAHLLCFRGGKATKEVWSWVDYLFVEKALRPGQWDYTIQYQGPKLHFAIRYDPDAERFVGSYTEEKDNSGTPLNGSRR